MPGQVATCFGRAAAHRGGDEKLALLWGRWYPGGGRALEPAWPRMACRRTDGVQPTSRREGGLLIRPAGSTTGAKPMHIGQVISKTAAVNAANFEDAAEGELERPGVFGGLICSVCCRARRSRRGVTLGGRWPRQRADKHGRRSLPSPFLAHHPPEKLWGIALYLRTSGAFRRRRKTWGHARGMYGPTVYREARPEVFLQGYGAARSAPGRGRESHPAVDSQFTAPEGRGVGRW